MTGFVFGTGDDIIDANVAVDGADTSDVNTAAAAVDTGSAGIVVLNFDNTGASATMTASELYTDAISADTNTAAGETIYVATTADADAAGDVFLFFATINSDNDDFASAELVATFGSAVLGDFHDDNFAGV